MSSSMFTRAKFEFISKESQCHKGKKHETHGKAVVPESVLQDFTDDYLKARQISFVRFSQAFMFWMRTKAPVQYANHFFSQWAGKMPDNFLMEQVAPGIFLCCKLELKTEDAKGRAVGKTHGKQATYAENEEWEICRNTKAVESLVDKFMDMANKIKTFLKG